MSDDQELMELFGKVNSIPWDSIIRLAAQGSVGQLLNGIGHELNNSLTPVLGYSQLLQENGMLEEECRTYAQRIAVEAEEISHTVETMLVLARRQHAGSDLVNLNDLVKETLALQKYEMRKHDVAIELRLARNLPPVVVDPYEMQIVFLNVVQNAIQALAGFAKERILRVCTDFQSADSSRLFIEFADNGPGIHPRIMGRVFEPFFTTKTPAMPSAVGLGLTICYYFVRKNGGTVSIQSRLGEGTQVKIELPITTELPDMPSY